MTNASTRHLTLAILVVCAASWLTAAMAQGVPRKVPRIAYVWLHDAGPSKPYQQAFQGRMSELGWIEGKTVTAEYRDAKGDPRALDAIMEELVRTKVDLIIAMCTPEAIAARKATSTIPIVVAAVGRSGRRGAREEPGEAGG